MLKTCNIYPITQILCQKQNYQEVSQNVSHAQQPHIDSRIEQYC